MNQTEFISGIKIAVADSAIESMNSTLTAPAGREPADHIVQLSKWYNALNASDRQAVNKIIQETIDTTVFGFLCVLDSVRTIEKSKDKGVFKLYYHKKDESVLLNDPDEDYLHDLWES